MRRMAITLVCILAGLAFQSYADVKPNGMVILLTDYGQDSIYVGTLKGAIYGRNLKAKVDSITNSIPPFDVMAGAFMLAEGCRTYPKGTVFCCVVDPGVGTSRRPIVLETKSGQLFVAPDNGLLSVVAEQLGSEAVYEITNRALWRISEPSTTFHGIDIFGPVSASLASGVPVKTVGRLLDDMIKLDIPKSQLKNGVLTGTVVRVDPYGNLITNIPRAMLEEAGLARGDALQVTIGKSTFTAPFRSTYADVEQGSRVAVIQSAGLLEFAINYGSLAEALGEQSKAAVSVRKAP